MTAFFICKNISERIRFMLVIKVWDTKKIDTLSDEIKDKISRSITDYITEHWDKCVNIETSVSGGNYEAGFTITL